MSYCKRLVKYQNSLLDFAEEYARNILEAMKKETQLVLHPNAGGWLHVTAKNHINHGFRTMYTKRKHETSIENTSQENYMFFDFNLEKNIR